MQTVTTVGLDIAKSVFQVHGIDAKGDVVIRRQVTNDVIRVALERDVRKRSRHPHIERIMQKQIRQDGAYDPSLRGACRARHDAAVLHLHRSLQPAFDVE